MWKVLLTIVFGWSCLCCAGQKMVNKKIAEVPGMILLDSTMSFLVDPNQISEVRIAMIDSVYYEVLFDDSSRIKYVSTSDHKFKSGEGIKVGDTFGLLEKRFGLTKKNIHNYRGWGL